MVYSNRRNIIKPHWEVSIVCPVLELAKYIVVKCVKDKHPISNLQLQKILYYIQREFLQKLGKIAFPESIEAWQFGPVVSSVYYYFCGAGAMAITLCDDPAPSAMSKFSREERIIIDNIVEEKRELNPWDMVYETHQLGGTWARVYNEGKGNRGLMMTEEIRNFG